MSPLRGGSGRKKQQQIVIVQERDNVKERRVADTRGRPFTQLDNLGEARKHDDGTLVLDSEVARRIYLTCPVTKGAVR